jgi:hypothetical protein
MVEDKLKNLDRLKDRIAALTDLLDISPNESFKDVNSSISYFNRIESSYKRRVLPELKKYRNDLEYDEIICLVEQYQKAKSNFEKKIGLDTSPFGYIPQSENVYTVPIKKQSSVDYTREIELFEELRKEINK